MAITRGPAPSRRPSPSRHRRRLGRTTCISSPTTPTPASSVRARCSRGWALSSSTTPRRRSRSTRRWARRTRPTLDRQLHGGVQRGGHRVRATGDVTIAGTVRRYEDRHGHGLGHDVQRRASPGMTSSGTVVATIGAGVATDAAGNANTASTSTDNTVTWDNVAADRDDQPGGGPGGSDEYAVRSTSR